MINQLFIAVVLTVSPPLPPPCWIRDDPADLELRISRFDSATTTLGRDTLKVCYSRLRRLGRPIMGRLVPFGETWRLGANEATTLHTTGAVRFGDVTLPAGSYSLYAIPGRDEWHVVVNSAVRRWGIPINAAVRAADLDTTIVPVDELATLVELFTVRFEPAGPDAVNLVMEWEWTRIRVPIRRVTP